MDQPLISVIVPVYKAEQSLQKCVDSIRNQSYTNLEIILVDDGSPDGSGALCDAFAQEDPRIRVFHKENGGQSSARNLGLDHMTGAYVTFVDSDDWIEPEYYRQMLQLMVEHGAQIGACGLQCDYADGNVIYFNPNYVSGSQVCVFSMMDGLREVTLEERITNSPCDKLFARSIFDGLRFREQRAFEDFEIMVVCLEQADKIVYDSYPYYHYVMTEQSVTRGTFHQKHFVEADVSRARIAHYAEKYPSLVPYAKVKHIDICLNIYFRSAGYCQFARQRREIKKELRSSFAMPVFRRMTNKIKIKYLLFLLSPTLYSHFMNCRHHK